MTYFRDFIYSIFWDLNFLFLPQNKNLSSYSYNFIPILFAFTLIIAFIIRITYKNDIR